MSTVDDITADTSYLDEFTYAGEILEDPNRQAVGLDPVWVEGSGGEAGEQPTAETTETGGLEAMTKDELLAYAQQIGATPANAGMTKADLIASIQAAETEPEA